MRCHWATGFTVLFGLLILKSGPQSKPKEACEIICFIAADVRWVVFFFPDNLSGNLQWIESFRAFKAIERFQSTPGWDSIMYLYMIYSYSFIHFVKPFAARSCANEVRSRHRPDLSGQEETKMRCAMLQWVRYWHITLLARSLSLHPKGQRTPRSSSKLIWKEGRFLQNQFSQYVFFFAYIQWLCSKGGCKMFWWLSNQQEL